jgi:hypothetical protein
MDGKRFCVLVRIVITYLLIMQIVVWIFSHNNTNPPAGGHKVFFSVILSFGALVAMVYFFQPLISINYFTIDFIYCLLNLNYYSF